MHHQSLPLDQPIGLGNKHWEGVLRTDFLAFWLSLENAPQNLYLNLIATLRREAKPRAFTLWFTDLSNKRGV